MRIWVGVAAAIALAAGAPCFAAGIAPVETGAAAPLFAGTLGAWGAAVSNLTTAMLADPALGSGVPNLSATLGRVRLELSLHPRSEAALSFLPYLPYWAASDPVAFGRLPIDRRASELNAAVSKASAELQPRAEALAARAAEGELTAAERTELDAAAASWFYLTPETAAAVKTAAAKAHGDAARGLAAKIAAAIPFRKTPDEKVVQSELKQVFAGAALIAAEHEASHPGADLVAPRLAPYVARALDESEARLRERGVSEGVLYSTVLKKQSLVFGGLADRSLFKKLRSRGEWTEFVAAASLHAADRFQAMGEKARSDLAYAAEGDDLRLPIPSWHRFFGRYPSIAHSLMDGKAAEPADPKSIGLFTAFGIPVRAKRGFFPAFALTAYELVMTSLHSHAHVGLAAAFTQGLLAALLLYGSLLAHEFGHVLAARVFGIRARRVVLDLLGAGSVFVRGARQALPGFVTSLAGPLVSGLAGVVFWLAARAAGPGTLTGSSLYMLFEVNVLLAAVNLMPLFPMDGAKIMRAVFTGVFGSYRATKIASAISFVLSSAMLVYGLKTAATTSLPRGLIIAVSFALFAAASASMSRHPGTVTIDERPSSKS